MKMKGNILMNELKDIEQIAFEELFVNKGEWTTFGDKFETRVLSDEEKDIAKKTLGSQFALFEKLYSPETTDNDRLNARDELFIKNKNLVIHMCKIINSNMTFTKNRSITFKDLIQAGNIGLLRSLESFNYGLGYRFATFSCIWIQSYIKRYIADNHNVVRTPVQIADNLNKLNRIEWNLLRQYHREPTEIEVSIRMGKSIKYLEKLREKRYIIISLHSPFSGFNKNITFSPNDENEDFSLIDTIQTEDTTSLIFMMGPNKRKEIYQAFKETGLKDKEIFVLKSYFGLETRESKSLEEVGKTLNVTKERIRQIKEKALRRLRRSKYGSQL